MVSKKILGAAIAAALLSQGAFAVIDGTAANNVTYAKEAVLTGDISALAATTGLLNVTAAGTELNLRVPIGFGVTSTTHAFVRFDLTNAKFRTAVSNLDVTAISGAITNVVVAQGGAVGDTYVILDITSGGLAQTDVIQLALAGLAVSPTAAVSITFNHYSTSPAAVLNNGSSLYSKSLASAVSVIEDLKTTIAAGADLTADVNAATAFTLFTPGATAVGTLGSIKFEYADANARLPSTGALVSLLPTPLFDTAAGKSTLAVSGDLSFTAGAAGATAATLTSANLTFGGVVSDVAATATSTTPTAKLTTLTNAAFNIGAAVAPVVLTATSAINAGSYSLTFTPAQVTGRQYAPSAKSGALANIKRNGATVQVPYLTTNAGLNQKVVLVNRGASDVTYSTSFTTEGTVTAAAGTAATGTLKAKQTLVLKATDLVTLTGGSRTAATITALAPATTIDAATQTVVTDATSVSFGSNDTVNLDVK